MLEKSPYHLAVTFPLEVLIDPSSIAHPFSLFVDSVQAFVVLEGVKLEAMESPNSEVRGSDAALSSRLVAPVPSHISARRHITALLASPSSPSGADLPCAAPHACLCSEDHS